MVSAKKLEKPFVALVSFVADTKLNYYKSTRALQLVAAWTLIPVLRRFERSKLFQVMDLFIFDLTAT